MNFSDFCALTKPQYFGYNNQAQYLNRLFAAAGIRRHYSDDYLKSVFNGTKPFSSNMKRYFPHPVNEDDIKSFYEKNLRSEFMNPLADAFGIPSSEEREASYLCYGLAAQVGAFISDRDQTDFSNIVPEKYLEGKIEKESRKYQIKGRLYEGDDVWVEDYHKRHDAVIYENFQHSWVIHNQGSVLWYKRRLICVNPEATGRRTKIHEFKISDLKPGEYTKITTEFNARGQEGRFISKWDMVDENGDNCFPGSRYIFDVEINTTLRK